MKLSINIIIQALGTVLQVLNLVSGMIPPKYQWLVAGLVGIIQAVTGMLAHWSNPDGTPATAPYIDPNKPLPVK